MPPDATYDISTKHALVLWFNIVMLEEVLCLDLYAYDERTSIFVILTKNKYVRVVTGKRKDFLCTVISLLVDWGR